METRTSYPRIVIIFPWEYSEQDPLKYECHLNYFPDRDPDTHKRVQQVALVKKGDPAASSRETPYNFEFVVSFLWPNLVVESDVFEDDQPRVVVPVSNFQFRGYPIHLAQYIGFEAIHSDVSISDIEVKQIQA